MTKTTIGDHAVVLGGTRWGLGVVDRPEGLLRPDRALRVLWAHLRGAAPAPATGPVSVVEPRKPVARPQIGSAGQRGA
ncbi:MAG: hypothetical protein WAK86_09455 [Pseudonocardiaceae bacterium]